MPRWITCRELLGFLDDYLASMLPADQVAEFENHLSNCPPCVAYMKGYRETVRLGKAALAATDDPAPAEVPEDLVQAILAARGKS
jgi:anti-sigma factor RsiW